MSLGVVLIHNGDPERITTATKAIEQFSKAAKKSVDVSVNHVSYQPSISPATIPASLLAWWLSVTGDHAWQGYLSPDSTPGQKLTHFTHSVTIAPKKLRKNLRRRKRVSVTRALTEKNIRAWQRMLDEGWDYLLVVEDDVVVAEGSEKEIRDTVVTLSSSNPRELLFASIARAVTTDDLGATGLVVKRSETLSWFSRPVSNTAAAYILSRALAEAFLTEVTSHRFLRAIPADWLLNRLFMRFHRRGIVIPSFHAKNGVFVNRSILGQLPSQTKV